MKNLVLVCLCLEILIIVYCYEKQSCEDKLNQSNNYFTRKSDCGPEFMGLCICSKICFEGKYRYVVNCTETNFQNAKMLQFLPDETEVLIFTGNNLTSLPWNVFGTNGNNSFSKLKIINMSKNKIREIKGKTYHHVKNVERLILDFNELSVDSENDHPRIFSNFESLLELHLTDAFENSSPRNLAETLHNVFYNSNLTQLIKLHIEQNEISEFQDLNVFCDLPSLSDLHLGDNLLTELHFNLSCVHKLRFLDLQRNKFTKVLEKDLKTLNDLTKHNRTVTIDFSGNPLECSCHLNPFIEWINKTKILVRNKNDLRCEQYKEKVALYTIENCVKVDSAYRVPTGTTAIMILSLIIATLICAFLYVQREQIKKKVTPVIVSVNKRVRYTSIETVDNCENNV
ncbi:SLIT and NTRK-like protein 4 isoform X2 [Aphidius gifuensis]|nr:SLIT and NTRK-like protein 4 isoform X2 [Aphidius gifuensis]